MYAAVLCAYSCGMQVYATDGDDTLGGSDIDLCLFKILKDRIREVTDIDIATLHTNTSNAEEVQKSAVMCTAAAVHTMAEDVKKALTYADEVAFQCTMPQVSS